MCLNNFFSIDLSGMTELEERISKYQGDAEKAINKVLLGTGADEIKREINIYMPRSKRKFTKTHKKHAKDVSRNLTQKQVDGQPLAVWVKTVPKTQYLYFPDDGSNTKRHAGLQHFMYKGADKAKSKVIDLCLGELSEI